MKIKNRQTSTKSTGLKPQYYLSQELVRNDEITGKAIQKAHTDNVLHTHPNIQ